MKLVFYFSSLIPPFVGLLELPGEPWAQKATYRTRATGHTRSVLCVLPLFMHGSVTCNVCYLHSTSCICSLTAAGDKSPLLPGPIPEPAQSSKAVTVSLVSVTSSCLLVPFRPSTPSCPWSCFSSATLMLLFLCCFALFSCSFTECLDAPHSEYRCKIIWWIHMEFGSETGSICRNIYTPPKCVDFSLYPPPLFSRNIT